MGEIYDQFTFIDSELSLSLHSGTMSPKWVGLLSVVVIK